jgi:hypothetical protein
MSAAEVREVVCRVGEAPRDGIGTAGREGQTRHLLFRQFSGPSAIALGPVEQAAELCTNAEVSRCRPAGPRWTRDDHPMSGDDVRSEVDPPHRESLGRKPNTMIA